jgi:hypothetical protein
MHEFALLAFGGLVTALAVRFVSQYAKDAAGRASSLLLWLAMGVGYAYLVDFQIFSAWGMDVRSHHIGAVMTGFMVGGFAMLWEEALAYFHSYAERHNGKKSLHRAA